MIQRGRFFFATLLIAGACAMLTIAPPVQGQIVNSQVIQMANLLADMQKTIDAKKAKPGQPFTLKTVTPATLNTGQVIPLGSILEGHVDSATRSVHHSDSTLVVTIDKLHLKGGKEVAIKAVIVRVASLEPLLGGDSQAQNQQFDRGRMQGSSAGAPDQQSGTDETGARTGPHPVKGLSVTSSVTGPNSGTFTQKRNNVHLTNENQFEVSLAVIPKGVILQK